MPAQLLVALVVGVDGEKERRRIRDVDRDRQAERAACFPHRIEPLVVDRHERPLVDLFAEEQPEHFQDLESLCPGLPGTRELVSLPRGVAGLRDAIVGRLGEDDESVGVGLLERPHCLREAAADATREIDERTHVAALHQ